MFAACFEGILDFYSTLDPGSDILESHELTILIENEAERCGLSGKHLVIDQVGPDKL